jgi:dUTPase
MSETIEIPMFRYQNTMVLSIYIDSKDEEFIGKYKEHVKSHNEKLLNNQDFADAGFDLLCPMGWNDYDLSSGQLKLNYQIKCMAGMCSLTQNEELVGFNTGYYIYPRSSISKTSFRLANGTGIIDAGYRGNLIGMFDIIGCKIKFEKYDRLVQICSPNLCPIFVKIVDTFDELGEKTSRGDGAFGSTGK